MRLFKANQQPLSAEDEAAIVRLMALANRFKAGDSTTKTSDGQEESGAAERPQ
jgi:hypothetical protein